MKVKILFIAVVSMVATVALAQAETRSPVYAADLQKFEIDAKAQMCHYQGKLTR